MPKPAVGRRRKPAKGAKPPEATVKPAMGRPSGYKPEYAAQAEKLLAMGWTDKEVADFFEVSVRTIYRWQNDFPDFCQALKVGKEPADDRVERSLYHKAVGYTHETIKIMQYEGSPVIVPYTEHVAPDTTAAIFWLKNRRPDKWRDVHRQEHTGPNGAPIKTEDVSGLNPIERAQRLAALLVKTTAGSPSPGETPAEDPKSTDGATSG